MSFVRSHSRTFSIIFLVLAFAFPSGLLAQTHVVSPADLQQQALSATQARERNIQKVRDFIAMPAAQKTLRDAHINSVQVQRAVGSLSNAELAQLASRADRAQHDFAAGYLSTLDIALIILGVALIILIIVVAS